MCDLTYTNDDFSHLHGTAILYAEPPYKIGNVLGKVIFCYFEEMKAQRKGTTNLS